MIRSRSWASRSSAASELCTLGESAQGMSPAMVRLERFAAYSPWMKWTRSTSCSV
ncbi:hypothetical protein ACIF6K_25140 [Streptomyces sp. NPDC085942]|uniref:hypothetical protein n=1 Tax=Streptomyces sp. NPDC085942 TaxID=3365743 RepID=UPI0037D16965